MWVKMRSVLLEQAHKSALVQASLSSPSREDAEDLEKGEAIKEKAPWSLDDCLMTTKPHRDEVSMKSSCIVLRH